MFRPVRLGLHSTAPPDIFKFTHYEARAVGKRAVGIPLECFLVVFVSTLKVNSRFVLEQFHVVGFCMLGVPP